MVDPITVEVVSDSLTAISNEMSFALQRASYNMMIYEVRDYCCAILDTDGNLLSQNVGGVSHFVADLGVVIKDGVETYGKNGFKKGDVIVMNHERVCGQHLNNFTVYTPLFFKNQLVGFAIVRAHWLDVGGLSTGFGAGDKVTDPWTEGLQLDQLKLYDGGKLDEKLLRLISDNIRTPESSLGDLRGQMAACRLGERRFIELLNRYGKQTVFDAVEIIFDQAERRARNVVKTFKSGTYEAESFLDDDFSLKNVPVPIKVKVTIKGSDMTVDLSESSPQRAGTINSRTFAAPRVAYKCLTDPFGPINEGSFRALKIILPEGNMMMARYPAVMASWSIPIPLVIDTIFRALDPAIEGRIPAAHKGVMGGTGVFFGIDPKKKRRFIFNTSSAGGWGGRPFEDGPSASVNVCQGDVRNSPIEKIELKYPILMESRGLRQDSGGPGKYRGGLGQEMRVRGLVPGTWNLQHDRRRKCPPWGLRGGNPGMTCENMMQIPGESELKRNVDVTLYRVPADTEIIQLTTGGGGWGDPLERDPAKVQYDVIEGLVSLGQARDAYGVVLNPDLSIDMRATEDLRSELREKNHRSD